MLVGLVMVAVSCSSWDDSPLPSTASTDSVQTQPRQEGEDHLDTWWSGLSQVQRNQLIVSRGAQQLGQVSGQTCKEWVRTVVSDASAGAVLLPPTRPNGWQWYGNVHVRLVAQNACPANLQSGHIVQMRLRSGLPHTAIIHSCGSWGMTWLDANWVNYNNPVGQVALHSITWPQFYQQAVNFSFYEIIG